MTLIKLCEFFQKHYTGDYAKQYNIDYAEDSKIIQKQQNRSTYAFNNWLDGIE